ncbi:hypothetical protein [Sodalis sp. RH18]|uniref:hypothetical protein n=1 Tax=Sodalis sp. RH18 TaxID=3394333 RepID=UPI0039B42881
MINQIKGKVSAIKRVISMLMGGITSAVHFSGGPAIISSHDVRNIAAALGNCLACVDEINRDLEKIADENIKLNTELTRLKYYEAAFDSIIFAITGTGAGQDIIDSVDVEILTKNAITAVRQLESERLQAIRFAQQLWVTEDDEPTPIDSAQVSAIRAAAIYTVGEDIRQTLLCVGPLKEMTINAPRLITLILARADYYRRQAEGAL